MRVHICGVRGSTPAPGPEYVRYGGHTSCVAIGHGENAPTLVLDGGTGLQRLSPLLGDGPFRGSILLGHLHWDHTHGLPFFPAGNLPDSRVDVYLPAQGDAEAVIARAFSPPHFPVRLTELQGAIRPSTTPSAWRRRPGSTACSSTTTIPSAATTPSTRWWPEPNATACASAPPPRAWFSTSNPAPHPLRVGRSARGGR